MNIIYVLKSSAYGDNQGEYIDLIKIGFSDNWSKREASYKNHNPTIKLLFLYEGGSLEIEKSIQQYFKSFQYKYGRDWFYYNETIIDFFKSNSTLDEIMKIIPLCKLSTVGVSIHKIKENLIHLIIATRRITGVDVLYDLRDRNLSTEEHFLAYMSSRFSQSDAESIMNLGNTIKDELEKDSTEILKFQKGFEKEKTFQYRMRYLCEFPFSSEVAKANVLDFLPEAYRSFYVTLGPEKCRSVGYDYSRLKKLMGENLFDQGKIKDQFLVEFKVGDKWSKVDLKNKVSDIYSQINYTKTPKATDLEDYFELKTCKVKDSTGKWVNGFEIISLRP